MLPEIRDLSCTRQAPTESLGEIRICQSENKNFPLPLILPEKDVKGEAKLRIATGILV